MKRVFIFLFLAISLLQANFTRDETSEVVTDLTTGLIWQDNGGVADSKYSFDNADKYCSDLELAGFDDWRVPSVSELLTIADMSKYKAAIDNTFNNIGEWGYWSSTLDVASGSKAWQVFFSFGKGYLNSKSTGNYVRCVKGDNLDDKKSFSRDDTLEVVGDSFNALMWQDTQFNGETKQDWQSAVDYCDDLEFAGYTDWELPTIEQLRTIVDYSRFGSAISSKFDNVGDGDIEYYSSTTYVPNGSNVWAMFFNEGIDSGYARTNSYYTRCVRKHGDIVTPTITPTPTPSDDPTVSPTPEPTTPSTTDCEINKNSLKIVDNQKCELQESWEVGDSVKFQFFYKNNLGKEFEGDTFEKCAVKNSEVALFNNVTSEVTFRADGVASLTCVYYDMVVTHQFFVGDYEKSINSAVIVVGKGSESDKLKDAFVYLGNEVYRFLSSQGYSLEEISYFNSFGEQKLVDTDLDGNKDNVVDNVNYSFEDVKDAILAMPVSDNPLLVYLIDHGLKGGSFLIDSEQKIEAKALNDVLDEFQEATKRKVVLVVDTCYSGAFVEAIKGENRVVMSSGTADQTIPMSTSGISFTNYFIKNLQDKKSIKDSFEGAYNSYRKIAKNTYPQADFTDEETANKPFGYLFNASADVIKSFTGKSALKLPQSTRQTFSLKVDNVIGVEQSQAFVTLTPPQTVVVSPTSQDVIEIQSTKVPLTYNSSTGEFTAEYDLNTVGYYETVYEIIDEAKEKVISDSVTIQVGDSTNGVEIVESSDVPVASEGISLDLISGWNLISLPTNQNLDNPLDFFSAKIVWTFEDNTWSKNPSTINYSQGFWVSLNEDKSYSFSGSEYSPNLSVGDGWNLLGTGKDLTISELSSFSNIWAFRGTTWLNKDALSTINRGEGFWVKK